MSDSADRSQTPTPRRRQLAREQGRVARSRQLSNAFAQTVACAGLLAAVPKMFAVSKVVLGESLARAGSPADGSVLPLDEVQRVAWQAMSELAPWFVLAMVSSAGIQVAQGGFMWLPHRVIPNFSRINPVQQWNRVFGFDQVAGTFMSFVKVAAIIAIAGWVLWNELPDVRSLGFLRPDELIGEVSGRLARMLLWIGLALLLFGGLDYVVQWHRLERDLRMSPEEQRDDVKAVENDVSKLRRKRGFSAPFAAGDVADQGSR